MTHIHKKKTPSKSNHSAYKDINFYYRFECVARRAVLMVGGIYLYVNYVIYVEI